MSPRDQSQSAPTLPTAKLNPLLNPLLAENMGRWAEVYFTSPPEKREQAVLELVRELELQNGGHEGAPKASSPSMNPQEYEAAAQSRASSEEPQSRPSERYVPVERCNVCGGENPASHRFCGMCGAKLGGENRRDVLINEEEPAHEAVQREAVEEDENSAPQSAPSYYYTPSSNTNGLSLFQDAGDTSYEDHSGWDYEPEPSPSYRIYIGVALALVILALGYIAWRGAQASQASQGPPPAPPAAKEVDQPQAAAPAPKSDQTTSDQAPSKKEPEMAGSSDQAGTKGTAEQGQQARSAAPAASNQVRRVSPSANAENAATSVQPAAETANSGNGSEELAIAQRYLGGASGQRRDSAEASKWLWKSIAKQNSEATLLLADLYLKGDGVSKNCDQARVLLDSAARKGMAGAGERLRNLQAFGCQ